VNKRRNHVGVVGVDVCTPDWATAGDLLATDRIKIDTRNADCESTVLATLESRKWFWIARESTMGTVKLVS
jgi:hypothetical protein